MLLTPWLAAIPKISVTKRRSDGTVKFKLSNTTWTSKGQYVCTGSEFFRNGLSLRYILISLRAYCLTQLNRVRGSE